MTEFPEWRKVETLYFEERAKREAKANAAMLETKERAAQYAQKAGIPTSDPSWPLYLHNWFAVDLAHNRQPRVTSDEKEIAAAKQAIAIMDTLWNAHNEFRKWESEYSPHPYISPKAYAYWKAKLKENPTP